MSSKRKSGFNFFIKSSSLRVSARLSLRKPQPDVGIHFRGSKGKAMADLFARSLKQMGIFCQVEPNVDSSKLKNIKLLIILLNNEYNKWAGENSSSVEIMLKSTQILVVVNESSKFNDKKAWKPCLAPAANLPFIVMIKSPYTEELFKLTSTVAKRTGIIRTKYFITAKTKSNPTSVISIKKSGSKQTKGFGAGGMFEAYEKEVTGTVQVQLGKEILWVSPRKTQVNMLEWRLFKIQKHKKRFLLTSDKSENTPGWSFERLFYAPGRPSLGDDQENLQTDTDKIRFHIFNSHNWGNGASNHNKILNIHKECVGEGINSWIDEE